MNGPPKISIVIPVLNQESFIEEAIISFLEQDYPGKELLIIDGGSTDGTVDIIREYRDRIKYFVTEKDEGQSHAINKGLAKTEGELFNWLNADDTFRPGAFRHAAELYKKKNALLIAGRMEYFGDFQFKKQINHTPLWNNNLKKTIGMGELCQPAMFFDAKAFKRIGPLNQKLQYAMDREWYVRFLLRYGIEKITLTDQVYTNFRLHGNSKTVNASNNAFFNDNAEIYQALADYAGLTRVAAFLHESIGTSSGYEMNTEEIQVKREIIISSVHYFLIQYANYLFFNGKFKRSKQCISYIDPQQLEKADRSLLRRLKIKTASKFLAQLYKNWHGKDISENR